MVAFLSGAVLTAANLNSAFNALTFRAVTGTSDTFVLADNGGAVSYSNASAITATVPPFSSVAYANGTRIQLLNLGAGVVTVTAGVGVTLNGSIVTLAQNTGGTLIKTATNTWYFLPSAPGSSPIAQVVRATDTTDRSTTSTSPVDVTGMAVTITPKSATSNIMIILVASLSNASSSSGSNHFASIRITDASNVGISGAQVVGEGLSGYSGSGTMTNYYPVVMIAWASPGSTAAVTYKARFSTGSAATTSTFQNATSTGQMFAIEVSA